MSTTNYGVVPGGGAGRGKRHSLPTRSLPGGGLDFLSPATDSRRSSLARGGPKDRPSLGDLAEQGETQPRSIQVVRFVYSQAVEKAFRRTYRCSLFGPLSAAGRPPSEPDPEILRLPELYSDFLTVKQLGDRNRSYIRRLRAESQTDSADDRDSVAWSKGGKLPRLSLKGGLHGYVNSRQKSRSRTMSLPTSSLSSGRLPAKLPSIVVADVAEEELEEES